MKGKMKEKSRKSGIALILAAVLMFSLFAGIPTEQAKAANGPAHGVHIVVRDTKTDIPELTTQRYWIYSPYPNAETGTLPEASYDAATNTMTLNNFNYPNLYMDIEQMGDDFKIRLIGENHLQYLQVNGDSYYHTGCSCTLTGLGTLYVNENKVCPTAVSVSASWAKSSFESDGGATLHAYAPDDGYPIFVQAAVSDNSIIGTSTPDVQAESSKAEDKVKVNVIGAIPRETSTSHIMPTSYDTVYQDKNGKKYVLDYHYWEICQVIDRTSEYAAYYVIPCRQYPNKEEEARAAIAAFGLTETGKTLSAYKMSVAFDTEVLKKTDGSDDGRYVFLQGIDQSTLQWYYTKRPVSDAVYTTITDMENKEITFYLADTDSNPVETYSGFYEVYENGYQDVIDVIPGYYDVYVKGNEFTLTSDHKHIMSEKWMSDTKTHWMGCIDGDLKEKEAAHTFTEKVDKEATVSEEGSKHEECNICGYQKAAVAIPKLPAEEKPSTVPSQEPGTGTEQKTEPTPTPAPTPASEPKNNDEPVIADDGNQVTTTSNGEAAVTEVKKTTKKTVTVSATTIVDGVKYQVTTINANAFQNASKAKTVTLPNTITNIKANAFTKSKITKVNITLKKGAKITVDKKAFKQSKVKTIQITMSKSATKKEKNAAVKAFTKAGIKSKNVKIKLK